MNNTCNIKIYFSEADTGGICKSVSEDNQNKNSCEDTDSQKENSCEIMCNENENSCISETESTSNEKIYETKRFVKLFFAK